MEHARIFCTCIFILAASQVLSLRKHKFVPLIPRHCEGVQLCEEVLNYPHEFVSEIINDLETQGHYWHSDGDMKLENLVRPDFDYINLCASKVYKQIPLAVRDDNGEWYFVLNRKDDRPVQVVDVEQCEYPDLTGENATCGKGVTDLQMNVPCGYESRCHQFTLERKMTVLNKKGEVVLLSVHIPSCCNCVLIPQSTAATRGLN